MNQAIRNAEFADVSPAARAFLGVGELPTPDRSSAAVWRFQAWSCRSRTGRGLYRVVRRNKIRIDANISEGEMTMKLAKSVLLLTLASAAVWAQSQCGRTEARSQHAL